MKKNEQPTPPATAIAIDLGAMYTRVAEIWAEEPEKSTGKRRLNSI